MLEPPRDDPQQLRIEVVLEIEVGADVRSAGVGFVTGIEPREHLRAAGRVGRVLRPVPAVDVRRQLAPLDLVPLAAKRGADAHAERRRQPDVQRLGRVEAGRELLARQPPREERCLVRDSGIVAAAS